MNVEEEVEKLKVEIKRLGKIQEDGSYKVNQISVTPFFFLVNSKIFCALLWIEI